MKKFEFPKFITREDKKLWQIIFNCSRPRLFDRCEHCLGIKKCLRLWSCDGKTKSLGQLRESLCRLGMSFSYEVADKAGNVEVGCCPVLGYVKGDTKKIYYSYTDLFLDECVSKGA